VSSVRQGSCGEITVVSLLGVVGRDDADKVEQTVSEAVRSTQRRVLVDLRATLHLHYRVAGSLAEAAQRRGRIGVVGPSSYVRQILRLAGVLGSDVPEYEDLEEALRDAAA
jgi:anti-anti-sigma regulatory factor